MKKSTACMIVTLLMVLTLMGCTYTEEYVPEDTSTVTLGTNFETGQTSVTDEIIVPGENFSLVCAYDTGDYPLDNWRVTASKSINMTVNTKGLPSDCDVYIEHVHADISLKSTDSQIDGITQDSMDDSDHRIPTNGFYIDDVTSYNNTFAIEGYTDQFYTLWGHAFGEYGHVTSSYDRLTEGNIRKNGTYAEKLTVVYDVVIITPACPEGYVRSVCSEILIPLTGEVQTVTKDFWTDEIVEPQESEDVQGDE